MKSSHPLQHFENERIVLVRKRTVRVAPLERLMPRNHSLNVTLRELVHFSKVPRITATAIWTDIWTWLYVQKRDVQSAPRSVFEQLDRRRALATHQI